MWPLMVLLKIDWFEGAIAQPQVVLRDLIEVLYPMTIEDGYDTTYFRNVAMVSNDCFSMCSVIYLLRFPINLCFVFVRMKVL